jgi:hypothetical protein
MVDFFSKERRIEENRQRIKELYEQYKKTENYYPLFLAYITAFGLYFFDFIVVLYQGFCTWHFWSITILTGLALLYVLYLIWRFFKSIEWNSDYLPYGVYVEYPEEIIVDKPELENNSDLLHNELFDRYIKDLEDFTEKDLEIYKKKKNRLKAIWIPMIISLFLYSLNITTYKLVTIKHEIKETQKSKIMSPTKVTTNENKNRISDSKAEIRDKPQSSLKINDSKSSNTEKKTSTNNTPKKK